MLWVNTIAPSGIHSHAQAYNSDISINYRSGSCVTPRDDALWKTPVVQLLTDCLRCVEAGCHAVAHQVRIQPLSSAVNATLPACAAERRAAAPLLLGAGTRRCRSISPARGALSSKPAARRCCCRSTDGRTTLPPLGPRSARSKFIFAVDQCYFTVRHLSQQEARLSPKDHAHMPR